MHFTLWSDYQWQMIEASPDHSHLDRQKIFLQDLAFRFGAAMGLRIYKIRNLQMVWCFGFLKEYQ